MVWKDTKDGPKGRPIIDVRALNKIIVLNTYPIPLQTDILAEIASYLYIIIVDYYSFFY